MDSSDKEHDWFEGHVESLAWRPRPIILPWLVWAVVVGIVLGAALWPAFSHAEESKPAPQPVYVAHIGSNKLFLFQDACALGGWFEAWKKAQWFYQGLNFDACWKIQRDVDDLLYVHTVDADGDAGRIPLAMFRKDEGV